MVRRSKPRYGASPNLNSVSASFTICTTGRMPLDAADFDLLLSMRLLCLLSLKSGSIPLGNISTIAIETPLQDRRAPSTNTSKPQLPAHCMKLRYRSIIGRGSGETT